MRPAIVLFLLAVSGFAQSAGIEGVVVNQATGQGLSGVHIHFLTGDFTGNGGIDAAYGSISDQAGHYSVTDMKPGFYIVFMERAGFLQTAVTGAIPVAMITLKPGQRLADHKLSMTPRAVIAGRVVDEYGDPVQHVNVEVEGVEPNHAGSPFGNTNSVTDDRGEFRIVVAPGKYHLHARSFNSPDGTQEIRTDGSAAPASATIYYPSAANQSSASVVEAAAGRDISGLEIRLVRNASAGPAGRLLTISGVVTGLHEGQAAMIAVRSGEDGEGFNQRTSTQDGKFSLGGLQPGSYSVFASTSDASGLQSRIAEVRLSGSDVTGVQLILGPPPELTGSLEFTGQAPVVARTVRLEPSGYFYSGNSAMTGGEVDKNGAFHIANVPPGKYHAQVEPMPDNGYVKSVTVDGAVAKDDVLDFSRGVNGNRLKITVSLNGGQISGKVLDQSGEPVIGPLVMVFLGTDIKQMEEDNTNRVTDGKYSFKAIRPGKYHLIAVDILQLASLMSGGDEDETMKALLAAGEEIEIKEGDRIAKDLRVIDKLPGKEAANAR